MMQIDDTERPTQPFAGLWRTAFGAVPPLGFRMRLAFPDRWTRFHALPGSTRDAHSDAERAEVQHRTHALGTALFGIGTPVWLIIVNEGAWASRWIAALGAEEALTWRDPDEDPSGVPEWVFRAVPIPWPPRALDGLAWGVADDQARVLLADVRARRVLAPYDGGFDVIASPDDGAGLRRRFGAWLSPRADGL